MKNILFVCTGNTCRSSMAKVLLRDILAKRDLSGYEVDSAGLAASPGEKASPKAILAVAELGLDLDSHRAKQLTAELLLWADLVLTMTAGHKKVILEIMPKMKNKVYTLKEWAGNQMEDFDIVDPYGQSEEVYCSCRDELNKFLAKAADKLEEVNRSEDSNCQ